MKEEIQKCVEVIKQGGVILTPTDTIWGLSCDATCLHAIERIYQIKQRPKNKNFIVLVNSDAMLNRYVKEVPELAWDIIDLSEKPTTIIYPEGCHLPDILHSDKGIAIRMVKQGFIHQLIQKCGKPLVSTSPNISGAPTPVSFKEIDESIKNQVDYVVNLPSEYNKKATPSSIIRLGYKGEIEIIRK